jgi:hypothetical protein
VSIEPREVNARRFTLHVPTLVEIRVDASPRTTYDLRLMPDGGNESSHLPDFRVRGQKGSYEREAPVPAGCWCLQINNPTNRTIIVTLSVVVGRAARTRGG